MAVSAAADLEPVAKVSTRLRKLLQHAKQVKPQSAVEPPLPTADFLDQIEAIHDDFDERYDHNSRFLTVEAATRDLFYSFITSADIDDHAFAEVWNLLDLVLMCGDHNRCAPELVCWLLEELLDSQTTLGCRMVFDYLDSRRERLALKDFHKKNLIFLRSCNELLRRLSRAEDAIFCGRVFFFLFQTFPLGDRSSVNLRGDYHTDNVTKFEDSDLKTADGDKAPLPVNAEKEGTPANVGQIPHPSSNKKGGKAATVQARPIDVPEEKILSNNELYPIFWRLQHDFSDPARLFDKQEFATFKNGLLSTIAKFKNTPTVVQTKAVDDDRRGVKRKHGKDENTGDDGEHVVDNYNPKYLTSRDLFDLELSDLAFQRHILVQALILLDFLLSLTEKAKSKLDDLKNPNRAAIKEYTLGDDDIKWALSTRNTITSYLSLTTEGRQYCRMVETVLARDKNWVRWKADSCPPMVRDPVSIDIEMKSRKSVKDTVTPRQYAKLFTNTMDLSFLNEEGGGGLEKLKDPLRYTAPTVNELVEMVKVDKLDLDFADGEEKDILMNKIQGASWRALRQAAKADFSLLDKVDSTKDLEEMHEMLKLPEEQVEASEAVEQDGDGVGLDVDVATQDAMENSVEPMLSTTSDDKIMQDTDVAG